MRRKSSSSASLSRRKKLMTCKNSYKSSWPRKRQSSDKNSRTSSKLCCEESRGTARSKWITDRRIRPGSSRGIETCWTISWRSRPPSRGGRRTSSSTPSASVKKSLKSKSRRTFERATTIQRRIRWCLVSSESSTLARVPSFHTSTARMAPCRDPLRFRSSTTPKCTRLALATVPNARISASILIARWAKIKILLSRWGRWDKTRLWKHCITWKRTTVKLAVRNLLKTSIHLIWVART